MKAEMVKKSKGKPHFDTSSTYFIEVTADKANLAYMTEAIRKHWGEDYSLVTNDGMELEDSTVTRGKKLC